MFTATYIATTMAMCTMLMCMCMRTRLWVGAKRTSRNN